MLRCQHASTSISINRPVHPLYVGHAPKLPGGGWVVGPALVGILPDGSKILHGMVGRPGYRFNLATNTKLCVTKPGKPGPDGILKAPGWGRGKGGRRRTINEPNRAYHQKRWQLSKSGLAILTAPKHILRIMGKRASAGSWRLADPGWSVKCKALAMRGGCVPYRPASRGPCKGVLPTGRGDWPPGRPCGTAARRSGWASHITRGCPVFAGGPAGAAPPAPRRPGAARG